MIMSNTKISEFDECYHCVNTEHVVVPKDIELCRSCGGSMREYEPIIAVVPIEAGDSNGIQHICPNCDFPKDDTLLWDMNYCFNCGAKLDWSNLK
jgi:ribosomal protein L37AE/L43A